MLAQFRSVTALIALVSPGLAQQTTVVARTDGDVAVLAQGGGQSDFDHVPPGTPIGTGSLILDLSARIDIATPRTYLSAMTFAYPTQPYLDGIGVNFFERAYARGLTTDLCGTSASPASNGAQTGSHALLLTFANVPGTRGKVMLSFRASPGTTGTVGATLDIGNDGTLELRTAQAGSFEFPVTMPSSGTLDVRVGNECHVTGSGNVADFQSCWTEIWAGFRPDRTASCTIASYGQGCGPLASATEAVVGTSRVVTFLVTGAFPRDPVIAVTGSGPLNLPLPGGCSLLSTVEVAVLVTADAAGLATHTMVVPATLTGTTHHQFAPVTLQGQNLVLTTSNGIRVDCR
ncbi:MAG: hypothetical protein IPM29_28800 [Planctomycetes bacterium]|nr:hypothetical protein [Planctomycetota bacterium]